jgi:hypothetical protein
MHSVWANILYLLFFSACQGGMGWLIGSRPMWVLRQRKWECLVALFTLAPFGVLALVWHDEGIWWGLLAFACLVISAIQGMVFGARFEAAGIIRKWLQDRQQRKGPGGPWN